VLSFLEPDATGGARLVTGGASGSLPERGYYVRPAVFGQVDPTSRIAREEIFGPLLSVFAAASDDAAIDLANDTIYGLGGAIWSGDRERALDTAGRIDSGQVNINGAAFNPRAPFGGYKQSGVGREIGDFGISDVLEIKAVQL
jgi:aldehyde dehydrogenase (NAD+)